MRLGWLGWLGLLSWTGTLPAQPLDGRTSSVSAPAGDASLTYEGVLEATLEHGRAHMPDPSSVHARASVRTGGLLELLFVGYSRYVSSQDGPTCQFAPSCSSFGLGAVHRCGLVRGTLLTFDRLQRDHGLSSAHYPIDPASGLARDPVDAYCPADIRAPHSSEELR